MNLFLPIKKSWLMGWIGSVLFFINITCTSPPPSFIHTIIESDPPGAKVFVDDQYRGITPLGVRTAKNTTKTKKLELLLSGHHTYQKTGIWSNQYFISLVPHFRNLELKFNIKPDLLFVDDHPVAVEKNITLELAIGNHKLFAYKKNYPFLEQVLKLKKESSHSIKLFFPAKQNRNHVHIDSSPPNTMVYYKSAHIGETPMDLRHFSLQPYSFTFVKEGYKTKNVILKVDKNESRSIFIRLDKIAETVALEFSNIVPNSQVILNDDVIVPDLIKERGSMIFSLGIRKDPYQYHVTHPDFYEVTGNVVVSNQQQRYSIALNAIPKIQDQPTKVLDVPINFVFDTVRQEGNRFYLSDYQNEVIHVYDQSLNHIKTFSFEGMSHYHKPILFLGFEELGMFLLSSRVIASEQIFQPVNEKQHSLITPTYLLAFDESHAPPTVGGEKLFIVFDNGDHAFKIYDFNQPNSRFQRLVSAIDFFEKKNSDTSLNNDVQSEYLLPLRFAQAIWFNENIVFTDIVNRDVKKYKWKENLPGYFLSPFETQPDNPRAITRHHHLVLIAETSGDQIWVYNQNARFLHRFGLGETDLNIQYLFILGNRLYVFDKKRMMVYYLV